MSAIKDKITEKFKKFTFGDAYVTVCGNREALIENVDHVYECNEIMARFRADGKEIIVWGEGLKLDTYSNSCCYVRGKISSVEIMAGGVKKL